MKYKVIEFDNLPQLNQVVNTFISGDWYPIGTMMPVNDASKCW